MSVKLIYSCEENIMDDVMAVSDSRLQDAAKKKSEFDIVFDFQD